MDRHYIPAMNEGVQGVPEEHPDDSTMFIVGIAQHSTQNKKGATVYSQVSQYNKKHSFHTDEKGFRNKNPKDKRGAKTDRSRKHKIDYGDTKDH